MARYIDAEKLIADGWRLERQAPSGKILTVMSMADVPTADVVEVVRCEKCKDFESHGNGKAGICRNKKLKPCLRYATDFCSYGERKEDENVCK